MNSGAKGDCNYYQPNFTENRSFIILATGRGSCNKYWLNSPRMEAIKLVMLEVADKVEKYNQDRSCY
jgi:hypothetical protein